MLFLSVFIELFCYLIFCFCWHYIIFFWLTYPCMIILKYNQTFGVLFIFFNPHIRRYPPSSFFIFNLSFGSPLCSVEFCPSVAMTNEYAQQRPRRLEVEWVVGEARRCRSDQVFELSTPFAFLRVSSREKSTFLHVRVTRQKFSPSVLQCWSISTTLPEPKPPEGHWCVFFPLL